MKLGQSLTFTLDKQGFGKGYGDMLKGSESFNRIAESLSDIAQSPAVKAATDTAEQIRASFADTGVDLNQISNLQNLRALTQFQTQNFQSVRLCFSIDQILFLLFLTALEIHQYLERLLIFLNLPSYTSCFCFIRLIAPVLVSLDFDIIPLNKGGVSMKKVSIAFSDG